MHRRTIAALAAVLVSSLLGLTSPTAAATPAAGDGAAAYGRQAFRATNHQRVEHDRGKFRHHRCLHGFAKRQATRMARQERMFHQDLGPILRRCHLRRVGENVAEGFPTGKAVVKQGWMRSPGHRRNILDRRFTRMEVVARRGDDGRWYASQVFGRPA